MGEGFSNGDVQQAMGMLQMVVERRAAFYEAFLAQTGLLPAQAEMCYGEVNHRDGEKIRKEFKVWFRPKEEAAELEALRIFFGHVAKAVTLPPLVTVKCDITPEDIEKLKQAVAEAQRGSRLLPISSDNFHICDVVPTSVKQMVKDLSDRFPALRALLPVEVPQTEPAAIQNEAPGYIRDPDL